MKTEVVIERFCEKLPSSLQFQNKAPVVSHFHKILAKKRRGQIAERQCSTSNAWFLKHVASLDHKSTMSAVCDETWPVHHTSKCDFLSLNTTWFRFGSTSTPAPLIRTKIRVSRNSGTAKQNLGLVLFVDLLHLRQILTRVQHL